MGIPVHNTTIFLHWYSFSALAPCKNFSLCCMSSSMQVCHSCSHLSRIKLWRVSVVGNGGSASTLNDRSTEPPRPAIVEFCPRHWKAEPAVFTASWPLRSVRPVQSKLSSSARAFSRLRTRWFTWSSSAQRDCHARICWELASRGSEVCLGDVERILFCFDLWGEFCAEALNHPRHICKGPWIYFT